ncbi:MAG TPA: DNA topoisomerase, partial [Treponemataceae bacterium]|nr:DNA topoisomerase [Treponemataceae bacterium]
GEHYQAELPAVPNEYSVEKKAQDAHEAIRPTYVTYTPEYVKEHLTRDQLRLYSIIWERFVSSQMSNARSRTSSIDIASGNALFRVSSTRVFEKGFYKVIKTLVSKDEKEKTLPEMKIGEELTVKEFHPEQHFTQGPARFTDASIVKTLEEKGIGRPSTYAPIISVLLDRYYVTRSNKQLVPTQLGRIINDLLVGYFPAVINVDFTANVETELDQVEEGSTQWPSMIGSFYQPFKSRVDEVMETLDSMKGRLDETTDHVCELCGKPMLKKLGRFGFFLACSGFPECRNTRSIPLAKCPRPGCTGEIVSRRTKGRGKEFFGCTNYPECSFISHFKPINANCPKCGQFLVEKYDKKNGSFKSCINPDCDYLHTQEEVIPVLSDSEAEGDE